MNKKSDTSHKRNNGTVRWLLVDIGNVLLLKRKERSFTDLLSEELGIDIILAQAVNEAHYSTMETKYIAEKEFVKTLKKSLGYDAPNDIYKYFARAYQQQIQPNVELFNFLDGIRKKGVKTAVLSNTIAIYQNIQEKVGISHVGGFDPIIYSWREGVAKPDKKIFKVALDQLGADPDQVIFIDDSEKYIKSAESMGIKSILFSDTEDVIKKVSGLIKHDGLTQIRG